MCSEAHAPDSTPGPIVRITPREVHVCDPAFYDEIYASSKRRRDKDPSNVRMFGVRVAMAATVPHDLHRFRRSILEGFFSRRSVMSLSSLVMSGYKGLWLVSKRLVLSKQLSASTMPSQPFEYSGDYCASSSGSRTGTPTISAISSSRTYDR